MQSEGTGKPVTCYWDNVSADDVIKNKRLKLFGIPLSDWLVCSKCNSQQAHHAQNGNDFDKECWECGAPSSEFLYMDELARQLQPQQTIYRLKR